MKCSLPVILLGILLLSACASYNPPPYSDEAFSARAEEETIDGVTVRVAVLNREEALQVFGSQLEKRGIQPVWLEIQNDSTKNYWFMLRSLDPNYFSAHEAAYMNHRRFGGNANAAMDEYFSKMAIDQRIRAGSVARGFAFINETVGTREIRVRLYRDKEVRDFEFFVSIPGVTSDWQKKDLTALYPDDELVKISTESELQAVLRNLRCCTDRQGGLGDGLPVNIVFIDGEATLRGLIKSGWQESSFRRDFSNLIGAEQLYGRTPDIVFSKSRRKVDSTNTLRLWVAPIRYRGEVVVVGTIHRSTDPDIDGTAMYLLEDLATAETVHTVGFVDAFPAIAEDSPVQILGSDKYWSRGRRLVIQMSLDDLPLEELQLYDWQWQERTSIKSGEAGGAAQ